MNNQTTSLRLLGVALLAAGGLVLEITLTRVLSVIYFHAYVYILLSAAMLGIGLGAALAGWRRAWREPRRVSLWAALSALSALLLTVVTVWGAGSILRFLPLLFAVFPYLFLGLVLATVFSSSAQDSPRLYWADLSGAGLGTLLSVPLLNALGGTGGMLAAALLLALAALGLRATPLPRIALLSALLTGAVLLGNLWPGWLAIDLAELRSPKPITSQLQQGARIVETDWSALARTDLLYRPDQDAFYLYVDGGAGALVPAAGKAARWQQDIGWFPFVADRPESVLVIGPGGGLDIALARAAGVRDIVAVEINRASVELVRGLGAYTGGVYGEGLEVHIDEGRSVLRRMERRFDLIFLSQVVTQAAEARGYALTENSVYTVEAFHDYLDHLTPQGQIALKLYDELTLTRALTTAVRALSERGHSEAEAARHLMAVLDTRASPPIPLLLVRARPLERSGAIRLARRAEALELALLFVPGLLAPPPLDGLVGGRTSLEEIVRHSAEVDISPTTDNRPFFYQFEPGLPAQLKPLVYGLVVLLLLGTVALLFGQRHERQPFVRWSPLLFAALGFGFMTVEIALLQRLQLFLGRPTLTLSVVLGTLLIGGGLGSGLVRRTPPDRGRELIATCGLLVALMLTVWTLLWPLAAEALHGAQPLIRIAVVATSLVPLAIIMGMPFPLALQTLGRQQGAQVALGWAVNGVMSVAGSISATVLALLFGFASVSLAGGVSYLIVTLVCLMTGAAAGLRQRLPSP